MKTLLKLLTLLSASTLLGLANTWAAPARILGLDDPNRIPNSYIVVFKDNTKGNVKSLGAKIAQQHGAQIKYHYTSVLQGISIKVPEQALNGIANNPNVAFIEVNSFGTLDAVGSWGLDRIDQRLLPLNNTYTYDNTGTGVHAYIVDTGIRSTHNDFAGRMGNGVTFINDGNGTEDCYMHGTHVAGIVGGTTYGVAKGVILHPVRIGDCNAGILKDDVVKALDWVSINRIEPAVVNMSWGWPNNATSIQIAVNNLINSGVTAVASAGNSNANACTPIPAGVANAITVASTEIDDHRSSFSNYGSCVDIFAPGTNIVSASNTSDTGSRTLSGTSMAAPHVVGIVALYLENNPSATPAQVWLAIKNLATPDKVINPGTGSPNLLAHSKFSSPTIPSIPPGFIVTRENCYGFNFADWNASSGTVTQYELWASNSSSFSFPWLYYSGSFTQKSVNTSNTIYMKVKACNNSSCSAYSSQETATYFNGCL